ncbi:hypothetical protein ACFL35_15115 [Candidatus Riflebacteria bacterium]
MECPKCATTNPENAPVCSLCGNILKEKENKPVSIDSSSVEDLSTQKDYTFFVILGLGVIAIFLGKMVAVTYFGIVVVFWVYGKKNA